MSHGRAAGTDLQLDLPVLLPDSPNDSDACVSRLTTALLDRPGVNSVHILPQEGSEPAKLCIHYESDRIGLQRIRDLSLSLGAQLTEQFAHVLMDADGIDRPGRAALAEQHLRRLDGVVEAHVAPTGAITVEYDKERISSERVVAELRRMNVTVRRELGRSQPAAVGDPTGAGVVRSSAGRARTAHVRSRKEEDTHGHEAEDHGHDHAHGGIFGERTELIFSILCAVTLGVGFAIDSLTPLPNWLPVALYIAAYFFGGFYTLKEAIDTIRAGRFEIDFLMLIAAAGAAYLGELPEGALLLALFSIGHALEGYAMGRARRAIEALAELAPDTAVVRRDGVEQEVPVEDLAIGDVVVVKPNERLPADGFVLVGTSAVDQASVTGESVPVDKRPVEDAEVAALEAETLSGEHRIYAGTVNGSGGLEVYVTRLSSESTLARVVTLVTEAQTQTSPTQRFTDRFQRIFVPAVLALVVLLLFAWVVIDEPFSASLYRALAVLVAASPCALAISTPSAVLSGLARAARSGILIKGGGPLENLGTLKAIAFDKTGTLTEGKPRLTDVVAFGDVEEHELLAVASAIEQRSDHPLAAAIVAGAAGRLAAGGRAYTADEVFSITGRGMSAVIDGTAVHVGKRELFAEVPGVALPAELAEVLAELESRGRSTMVVRRGEDYLGALGVMDTPRASARGVLESLRRIGIRRTIMISGDNQRVADAVAAQVRIDDAYGDLLPEDKVAAIGRLRDQETAVAMVGDGVNDAPAMANSTVGIAMGAAGSDVAMETADVALMGDDLTRLPFAVQLSRDASRIIKQNLWASLGVVAVLIPSTVFGLLGIGAAVIVHEGSTLIVVANALRLLRLRDRTATSG